jgi:hypothetical protein
MNNNRTQEQCSNPKLMHTQANAGRNQRNSHFPAHIQQEEIAVLEQI